MADIPFDIPDLAAIRRALLVSPDVACDNGAPMVSTLNLLDGDPDGAFTVTLASGRVVTLHLFLDPPEAAVSDTILGAGTYQAGLKPTSLVDQAAADTGTGPRA